MWRVERLVQAANGLCLAFGLAFWFPAKVASQHPAVRGIPSRPAAPAAGTRILVSPAGPYGMTSPLAGNFTGAGAFVGGGGTPLTTPGRGTGFSGSGNALGGNFTGSGNF